MGGYSANLRFNKQRTKADGTASLYILVIIDRVYERMKLEVSWPESLIDITGNRVIERFQGDTECLDVNLLISERMAKISNVFTKARLMDINLNMKSFISRYNTYSSTENFIEYFETKLAYRWEKKIIKKRTYVTHTSSLKSLKRFITNLAFTDLTIDFLNEYKAYMYNFEKYDPDTVRTKLVNLRVYVKLAVRELLLFNYPFAGFKLPKQERRVEYLDEEEFLILKRFWESHQIEEGTNREKSLRAFMFVCYTGLRLGDLYAVEHSNIRKGILRFSPSKNEADSQKTVEIPLHDYAKGLIQTKKGKLFDLPSDATMRGKLSDIAIKLNIHSTMSPHIGRHTFATRFLRHGGRLEVLKELLGHEKIETTMIYVHVNLERKMHEIKMLPS